MKRVKKLAKSHPQGGHFYDYYATPYSDWRQVATVLFFGGSVWRAPGAQEEDRVSMKEWKEPDEGSDQPPGQYLAKTIWLLIDDYRRKRADDKHEKQVEMQEEIEEEPERDDMSVSTTFSDLSEDEDEDGDEEG